MTLPASQHRFADFDRVTVRIVEAEHPLAPALPDDRMDQRHAVLDAGEAGIDVVVLEIEQHVARRP